MENAITDAGQDKITSSSLSKQDITDELKICNQILYKLQLAEKVKSSKFSEKIKKENCGICGRND